LLFKPPQPTPIHPHPKPNTTPQPHQVPKPLEASLADAGARYSKGEPFKPRVEVDGRLVTGQNPASSTAVAEAAVRVMEQPRSG